MMPSLGVCPKNVSVICTVAAFYITLLQRNGGSMGIILQGRKSLLMPSS